MIELKLNIFLWKATEIERQLAESIINHLVDTFNKYKNTDIQLEPIFTDLYSYDQSDEISTPVILFGSMGRMQIQHTNPNIYWVLPELKLLTKDPSNKKTRVQCGSMVDSIAKALAVYAVEPTKAHVETSNGISIGLLGADIELSQSEIDNLLKIKELINGGKIVITKGDIKIEIES